MEETPTERIFKLFLESLEEQLSITRNSIRELISRIKSFDENTDPQDIGDAFVSLMREMAYLRVLEDLWSMFGKGGWGGSDRG